MKQTVVTCPNRRNVMDSVGCCMLLLYRSIPLDLWLLTEYPADCTKYFGPHSTDCLSNIWLAAKCLPKGTKYPLNLTTSELLYLDTVDLRLVYWKRRFSNNSFHRLDLFRGIISLFNETFRLAENGNMSKQMECLGLGLFYIHLLVFCCSYIKFLLCLQFIQRGATHTTVPNLQIVLSQCGMNPVVYRTGNCTQRSWI